jgi:tetratricopeptide (TPR) repeat protein
MAQHPNYVPALIVRGRCHLDGQADADAELAFLRVTELDPENVIALKSLAEISERAGRLPEAIRRLESLIYIDRNNEEARGQLDRVRELAASLASAPAPLRAAEPVAAMAAPEDEPIELIDRHGSEDLVPPPASLASEFQLPSDAETLVPSDDRLEEVELLGEVPEFDLPELQRGPEGAAEELAELSSGEEPGLLAAGDFSASSEFELSAPADAPEPAQPEPLAEPVSSAAPSEPELPGPWETAAMEAAPPAETAPAVLEMPVPIVDVQPPPPPPPAIEEEYPEPVAEEPVAPEPVAEEPVAAESEPELVVTETMAEIFLRQGHRELALAVYAQLAQRAPENARVAEA